MWLIKVITKFLNRFRGHPNPSAPIENSVINTRDSHPASSNKDTLPRKRRIDNINSEQLDKEPEQLDKKQKRGIPIMTLITELKGLLLGMLDFNVKIGQDVDICVL